MPAEPAELPGRVMVAGGRAVHVVERDGAGPTVLLLGGCGVPYYLWDQVVQLLPGRRIVRMHRPGIGTIWPGRLPTLAEEIDTLAELLSSTLPPAVIAAHSMAGLHAEGLARRRPDLVVGVVFVDGSVEARPPSRAGRRGGRGGRAGAAMVRSIMRAVPACRPLGSLADRLVSSAQSEWLRLMSPRPGVQRAVFRSPDAAASVLAELAAYDTQVADLFELRRSNDWPAVPVQVLTASDAGARWRRLQTGLARELRAECRMVDDSKHLMMVDRPDAIVHAISQFGRSS